MTSTLLITSPVWTAAGWTMLHVVWIGAAIGVFAALLRRLLKSARAETRYGVALVCLLVLSVTPVMTFVWIVEPNSPAPETTLHSTTKVSASLASFTGSTRLPTTQQSTRGVAFDRRDRAPTRSPLDSLVTLLPWIWLCGSLSTLVMLATGLIGVEQMRRSSRLVDSGDLPRRCRALADSLGIALRVSVGICDRLAMPVLIGIARPLILLPPAALSKWSLEQLEMVLLHELAHLRRWDNLVNHIQRFVESVLFFHPVVWWLSGWVRLERELCCDRLVVERVGQPIAYAEMLVSLAGTTHRGRNAALAIADRQVLTRIRRLLNQEERSMKLTMPEGLGLLGAAVIGISLALGLPAAQLTPVSDSNDGTQRAPGATVDDVKNIPVMEARPTSARANPDDTNATTLRSKRVEPRNPRAITLFPRDERQLQIVQLPTTPEGVVTYKCRGGIKIVCKSQKIGTIEMEADEAVIKRVQRQNYDERAAATKGVGWIDEADLPTEVHLKGNAIIRQDQEKFAGKGHQRAVRAPQLDYDFVSGDILVPAAESGVTVFAREARSKDDIKATPRGTPQDVPVRITPSSLVNSGDTSSTARLPAAHHPISVPPSGQRATSLFPRGAQRLQITQLPQTIEGLVTITFRGGIRIVSTSTAFGTVIMEANEAVIARNLDRRKGETQVDSNGETWVEEDELPMTVHLKGDVIFHPDQGKIAGKGDQRIFRASQLDYNFVTGRMVATDAQIETLSASGLPTSAMSASRIHFSLVRRSEGSHAPSEHRGTGVVHLLSTKPNATPNPSAKNKDPKTSEP